MKNLSLLLLIFTFAITACQNETKNKVENTNTSTFIKVGVFDKNGDSPDCITDALEALKIDKEIEPRVVSAAEIMLGDADDIDVFLFPGGSGRSETGSLGELGQQKVIELVKTQGKGVVGICAGAYILTETPDYPSLALSGGEAIDIEHDNRGHGLVKFSVTEAGKKIFPELTNQEIYFSQYYEGPVLIPAKDSQYKYESLATMLSDVHTVEGAPANMTNNRPFIIITDVEKGKTASVVGHPENTPGMRWIVPRLVRVVAGKELVSYNENVVRPEIYTKEILFTEELSKHQRTAYNNLIKSKEEKLKAMQDIVDMSSWSAKKWIPPMMRDNDFDVRLLAAKLTVYLERTDAINDLKAAVKNESNLENKRLLQEQLQLLENMLGRKLLIPGQKQ
ncbi:MAG TPA: biofilm PGA synthesis protein PgaB [Bacteroidales bacterium]|nr:biofilm PGA synthesis protein PgaB [Bacteroidales bacterium]